MDQLWTTTLGKRIEAKSMSQWMAMTRGDFEKYDAVVLPAPRPVGNGWVGPIDCEVYSLLEQNAVAWGRAASGNVVISGSDLFSRWDAGGDEVAEAVGSYVLENATATGLYIEVSSCHDPQNINPRPGAAFRFLNNAFGVTSFTVRPLPLTNPTALGCNDVTPVGTSAMLPFTAADLSSWGCSAHVAFKTFASEIGFEPIAMTRLTTPPWPQGVFVTADGTHGLPYMLIRRSQPTAARRYFWAAVIADTFIGRASVHAIINRTYVQDNSQVYYKVIDGPHAPAFVPTGYRVMTDYCAGRANGEYSGTSAIGMFDPRDICSDTTGEWRSRYSLSQTGTDTVRVMFTDRSNTMRSVDLYVEWTAGDIPSTTTTMSTTTGTTVTRTSVTGTTVTTTTTVTTSSTTSSTATSTTTVPFICRADCGTSACDNATSSNGRRPGDLYACYHLMYGQPGCYCHEGCEDEGSLYYPCCPDYHAALSMGICGSSTTTSTTTSVTGTSVTSATGTSTSATDTSATSSTLTATTTTNTLWTTTSTSATVTTIITVAPTAAPTGLPSGLPSAAPSDTPSIIAPSTTAAPTIDPLNCEAFLTSGACGQSVACLFDFSARNDRPLCRPRVCADHWNDDDGCLRSEEEGCAFDSACEVCHTAGEPLRCIGLGQQCCESDAFGDRCTWEIGLVYGPGQGCFETTEVPCYNYQTAPGTGAETDCPVGDARDCVWNGVFCNRARTGSPVVLQSVAPSIAPTTARPTALPTRAPTASPVIQTMSPTPTPTQRPTEMSTTFPAIVDADATTPVPTATPTLEAATLEATQPVVTTMAATDPATEPPAATDGATATTDEDTGEAVTEVVPAPVDTTEPVVDANGAGARQKSEDDGPIGMLAAIGVLVVVLLIIVILSYTRHRSKRAKGQATITAMQEESEFNRMAAVAAAAAAPTPVTFDPYHRGHAVTQSPRKPAAVQNQAFLL